MVKKLKLGTKISIIIGTVILICYITVFASILVQVKAKNISDSENLAKEVSMSYANQITSKFVQLEIVGKDLRDAVTNQMKMKMQNRQLVIEMEKEILNTHPEIFGATVAFEPNAYDGKDSEYKGQKEYGETGMLIPYASRSEDGIVVEAAYNEETDMNWYNKPKELKGTYITEPTTYTVNGKDVSMVSIFDSNKQFLGVISLDYKLDTMENMILEKTALDGTVDLISNQGIYIASGEDSTLNMKDAKENNDTLAKVISETSQGKAFSTY